MNAFFQISSPRELLNKLPLFQIIQRCLVESSILGIPDLLSKSETGSLTIEDLATKTKTDSSALYRVMRALANAGFYVELGNKTFKNSETTALLVSTSPNSLKNTTDILMGGEHFEALAELGACLKTGSSPYVQKFGGKYWEELAKHPIRGKQFNELMREKSEPGIEPIAKAYPFHEFKVIVDVAGGIGHLLEGVLKVAPDSKGVLFDLPAVIGDALKKLQPGSDLATRCTFQEGNMFDSVVGGGDLYMMKRVLHDWDDEHCLKILKNIQKQMKPSSKILIMDSIITPENKGSFDHNKCLDIIMLTLLNGKERTEGEFSILAQLAGLNISKVILVPAAHLSLIECELASGNSTG